MMCMPVTQVVVASAAPQLGGGGGGGPPLLELLELELLLDVETAVHDTELAAQAARYWSSRSPRSTAMFTPPRMPSWFTVSNRSALVMPLVLVKSSAGCPLPRLMA